MECRKRLGAYRAGPRCDHIIQSMHFLPGTSLRPNDRQERIASVEAVRGVSPFLVDSFQRQHNYLRISLTERCNLRCASVFLFISLLAPLLCSEPIQRRVTVRNARLEACSRPSLAQQLCSCYCGFANMQAETMTLIES